MEHWITRLAWACIFAVAACGSALSGRVAETSAKGITCVVAPDSTRGSTPFAHPAAGTTFALIVFVRFSDDTSARPCSEGEHRWPNALDLSEKPTWGDSLIDTAATDPLTRGSLTHFFWEMSAGKHLLVGDIYDSVIVPPYTGEHYDTSQTLYYNKIRAANWDVLQLLDNDPNVDFSNYDHNPEPNDTLDVIFLVYRWWPWGSGFTGWAGLFSENADSSIVVDDSIVVVGRQYGSGVCLEGLSLFDSRGVASHEYAHLLFGPGQPAMVVDHWNEPDRFGLMAGGQDAGNSMSAFERMRLSWVQPETLHATEDHWEVTLGDMVTEGDVCLIPVADSSDGGGSPVYTEYFLLENRQRKSYYEGDFCCDTCRWWLPGTGLLVTHVLLDLRGHRPLDFSPKQMDVECADGVYDWGCWVGDITPLEPEPECGGDWIQHGTGCWGGSGGHADPFDTFNEANGATFAPYTLPNSDRCLFDLADTCPGLISRFKQSISTGIGVINVETQSDSSMTFDVVFDMEAGKLCTTTTWSGFILLDGDVTVESGDTLIIEPGTTVRLADSTDTMQSGLDSERIEIIIEGTLSAEGTNGNFVRFAPDSCNWNVAFPESIPYPDSWYGIVVKNGGEASLKHCDIGYGVDAVTVDGAASVTIDSCYIHDNSRAGVCIEDGNPNIEWTTIADNDSFGVFVAATDSARMRFCVLDSNTTHVRTADKDLDLGNMAWPGPGPGNAGWNAFTAGTTCLQNTDASADSLLAHGNYWGSDDSSTVASQISGNVDYEPWLSISPGSISQDSSYAIVVDEEGNETDFVRGLCPIDHEEWGCPESDSLTAFILRFCVKQQSGQAVAGLDPRFLFATLESDTLGPACGCGGCLGWCDSTEVVPESTYSFCCQPNDDVLFATDITDANGISDFVDCQVGGAARLKILAHAGPITIGDTVTVWINSVDLVPCGDPDGYVSGPDFAAFGKAYGDTAWWADFVDQDPCYPGGQRKPRYLILGPEFAHFASHYHGGETHCSCDGTDCRCE
jgi:M6 family metalloprotease-like protein